MTFYLTFSMPNATKSDGSSTAAKEYGELKPVNISNSSEHARIIPIDNIVTGTGKMRPYNVDKNAVVCGLTYFGLSLFNFYLMQ